MTLTIIRDVVNKIRDISIMRTKNIISRSVAHRYHGVFLVFEFEGCPVLPSNVPGYPGMSYDIYTEMSDLKKKKKKRKRKTPFPDPSPNLNPNCNPLLPDCGTLHCL